MRKLSTTGSFDRDMKKVRKYPAFKKSRFDMAINGLLNGEKLDPSFKDHKAVEHSRRGFNKSRIFHVAFDIVVVYIMTDTEIILQAIGSHTDLFEEINCISI